ncbi:AMED_5909 family protein [Allokutzneria sp. NRRL B-24872]|uniref:AMED_5909 family protein n=1 Tax=Allokutzneria sp. NRRL B-24872 TaxID=1137961 RepID=UPI00352BE7FB
MATTRQSSMPARLNDVRPWLLARYPVEMRTPEALCDWYRLQAEVFEHVATVDLHRRHEATALAAIARDKLASQSTVDEQFVRFDLAEGQNRG